MVGKERSEPGLPLDRPEQVGVGRIGFDHDRRTLGLGVVDEDIYIVFAEIGLPGRNGERCSGLRGLLLRGLGLFLEVIDILENIFLGLFQKFQHLFVVLVLFLVGVHKLTDHEQRDFVVQFAVFFLELGLGLANSLDRILHLFMELVAFRTKSEPLLFAEVAQIVLRHRFALGVSRNDDHADL